MSEYKITDYTYEKAKELGVKIKPSHKKHKKIDVFDWNGNYICSIGDKRYSDYPTYKEEEGDVYADKRRQLYWIRHRKDANKIGSAGYYSANLLW